MKNIYAVSIRLVESLRQHISEISYFTALAGFPIEGNIRYPNMSSAVFRNLIDLNESAGLPNRKRTIYLPDGSEMDFAGPY